MIVDAHTHVAARAHFSPRFVAEMVRAWGEMQWPEDDLAAHRKAMEGVDRAIVVAMDAPAVGMVVPDRYVSDYVASQPDKLIGFASVDPNRPDALDRLTFAAEELGLRGLKVGPIYQHFDPTSPRAIALFRRAEKLGLPVLCHQGTTFVSDAPLRWARPFLIDDVARACPDLRLFIAHLGHPWCEGDDGSDTQASVPVRGCLRPAYQAPPTIHGSPVRDGVPGHRQAPVRKRLPLRHTFRNRGSAALR